MFRAYDVRGIYPDDLNYETSYKAALAYHKLLPDIKTVVIGQDVRESSDEVKKGFVDGLVDMGKEVLDVGRVPVSVVLFAGCHYKLDGSIMITGSHNPKQYTGIKIHRENAYPVYGDDLAKMRDWVVSDDLPKKVKGGSVAERKIDDDYIEHTTKNIKLARSLNIVIDSGNGVTAYWPEKIFKKIGCQVKTIYGEFDSNFPNHLPDPYEVENMQDLIKEVKSEGADLGIGYDGDGDRTGFIDEKGRMATGDEVLLILARQALKKYKKGSVVCEMRTSNAFLEEMATKGVEVHYSVGFHTAILNQILAHDDAIFGGETTGHIYFPKDNYNYDDAIFASLKLAEIVSEHKSFAEYVASLPRYALTPEIFIDTDDAIKQSKVEKFVKVVKSKGLEFSDVDGARVKFPNGWGLVRMSNTTPFIKTKFEGKTKKDLAEILAKMQEFMHEADIEFSKENKQELDKVINE